MIKVNKKINLSQLDKELNGLGLNATRNKKGEIEYVGLTETNPASLEELENAISNHIAQNEEITIEDKLNSIGLNLQDLKSALGIK